jgi:hypothetical protein
MENTVSKEVHEKDMQIMDERFKRDGDRLITLERMQEDFLKISTQLTEILKNQTKILDDHGERICALEKKPGLWFDRSIAAFLSATVAALIAYIVAKLRWG